MTQNASSIIEAINRTNTQFMEAVGRRDADGMAGGVHFDPKTDTIVRVQARKLRAKLEDYYAANRGPIRIRLVPGRYQPEFAHAREPAHEVTLAVLSFSGWMSGNAAAGPLTDSFTEELIYAVSRTPAIHVAATTSSFATRRLEGDARQIGRRLGVRHLVSGSIRWESGTVTVLAELADAETGFQEWSGRWDRPEDAVFQLPEGIALELALALGCEPRPVGLQAPDPAAHELFLRGRHYWTQRTEHGFRRALEHFRQALDIDPGMSRAWAALSETYLLLAMHGIEPPGDMLEKAKAAAERGLEFDADSAACHGALGAVSLLLDHDAPKAELEWRKAVALDPALIYHGLRDRDRTAHLIQEAEQDQDPWAFLRRVDPLWRAD
jgi:TolB-like protein